MSASIEASPADLRGPGWTEPQITALRTMVEAGKSARQIGVALGKTRNAIIGKASRMNLNLHGQLRQPGISNTRQAPKPKSIKVKVLPHARAALSMEQKQFGLKRVGQPHAYRSSFEPESAPIGARKIDLLSLEAGMCKWPLFTDGPRIYCAADVAEKSGKIAPDELTPTHSIYCAHHARRAVAANQKGTGGGAGEGLAQTDGGVEERAGGAGEGLAQTDGGVEERAGGAGVGQELPDGGLKKDAM